MTQHTLGQTAKLTGKSKSTITRAIHNGRLSASRQPDKSYLIDMSEIQRVWPATIAAPIAYEPKTTPNATDGTPDDVEVATLRVKVEMLQEMLDRETRTNDDLRERLDKAQDRILALPMATPSARPKGFWGRLFG